MREATDYQYEVALSFAGENLVVVEKIAERLKQMGISVFYDLRERQKGILPKTSLQDFLTEIYSDQAKMCVIFGSDSIIG